MKSPLHTIKNIKVLLDFFQKIAGVQGAAPPVARRSGRNSRAAHGAKFPVVQSAIRRWRNPWPKAMALAAAPVGVDGGGHMSLYRVASPHVLG